MAQQAPSIQAVLTQCVDRATFLQQTDDNAYKHTSAKIGRHDIEHTVTVFAESIVGHPVVLTLRSGAFNAQEYLTTAEARTLALALLLAADYADAGQHLLSASQRHEAQQRADEVAA